MNKHNMEHVSTSAAIHYKQPLLNVAEKLDKGGRKSNEQAFLP
jgi:hypothetical protein